MITKIFLPNLFIIILLLTSTSYAWSISFNSDCVGVILDGADNTTIGSGFITGENQYIVTCAHVITGLMEKHFIGTQINDTIEKKHPYSLYLPKLIYVSTNKRFPIELVSISIQADLAFLSTKEKFNLEPLQLADMINLKTFDTIIYAGWDSNKHAITFHQAKVDATSKRNYLGFIVDCVEFKGNAIPGYSGGPAFDKTGKVVGIISQAYYQRTIKQKQGEEIIINYAFSVKPLMNKINSIKMHFE